MASLGGRIRRARIEAGFESAAAGARALSLEEAAYRHYEADRRTPDLDLLARMAKRFNVAAEYLLLGRGLPRRTAIPIVGYVAAGGEGFFEDDYAAGAARDFVDPLLAEDRIALQVSGDSMIPRFRDGEVLIFGPRHDDPAPLLGTEVMARLADGRKLVKILRRGSHHGVFSLYSYNSAFDPIEDAELLWALPFEAMRVR